MQTALKRTNEAYKPGPSAKRAVKMQGNVAYINNNYVRQNRPAAAVKASPKTAADKAAKPRTGLASTLFVLLIAFGAMAALVSRYAVVCSVGSQNNALKEDIQTAESQIEDVKLQIELNDDLEYVQDTAENDLGMKYPDPDQKIYVDTSG